MPHVVPQVLQFRFDEIIALIDAVCRTHLTDEDAAMARELAAGVARKRPSPLLRGHRRTWACGITYTVGTANVLLIPHSSRMCATDLCALFGASQSAGAANSREIMRLFDIVPLDPGWTLPSRLAENPDPCAILSASEIRLLDREVRRALVSSFPRIEAQLVRHSEDTIRWHVFGRSLSGGPAARVGFATSLIAW